MIIRRTVDRFRRCGGLLALLAVFPGPVRGGVSLEAYLVPDGGGSLHVRLTGGDRTAVTYEEISSANGPAQQAPFTSLKSVSLVEPPVLQEAMSLYGSRRYRSATEKFQVVAEAYRAFTFLKDNPATLAEYHMLECLRQEGDLEALAKAAAGFDKSMLSHESQRRQIELYALWEAVRAESWERVTTLVEKWRAGRLPCVQQAQVSYCLGRALEGQGKGEEALVVYQQALGEAAGAADLATHEAAVHILRIWKQRPECQEALKRLARKEKAEPGDERVLQPLAGLVKSFLASYGGGEPLPVDLRDLMVLGAM